MSKLAVVLKFRQDNDETVVCHLIRSFEARLVDPEEGDLLFDVRVPYTLYKDTGERVYDPLKIEVDDSVECDAELMSSIRDQVKKSMIEDGITERTP